jgi:Aminoglycoside 3-N-acetyltransferase
VHTRMSAIGWVVGGAQTVVTALLDVLGPAGTLMAYQSKNDYEQWTARHDSSRPSPALPRRRARIWQQEAALAAARRRADQARLRRPRLRGNPHLARPATVHRPVSS